MATKVKIYLILYANISTYHKHHFAYMDVVWVPFSCFEVYMLQHYIYGEMKQIFNNNLIEYY
jgi:hypothetical protein